MRFKPRAVKYWSLGPCDLCGFEILRVLEMGPTKGAAIGIGLRIILMCGCGIRGRTEEETCHHERE